MVQETAKRSKASNEDSSVRTMLKASSRIDAVTSVRGYSPKIDREQV